MKLGPGPRKRFSAALSAVGAAAVVAAAASTTVITGVPARAAGAGDHRFTTRIQIGTPGAGGRSCTGALVGPRWVVTAKSCFSENGQPVPQGRPARPTTVTLARPDLTQTGAGYDISVVELVPHPDRDVVLAKLAVRVTDVEPVAIASTAAAAGDVLDVAGYGRTATAWVPDQLHTGAFRVADVNGGLIRIVGTDAGQVGPCRGDGGGPGLRQSGDTTELVAITHSATGQGGCFGGDASAPRGGTQTRLDDLRPWFDTVLSEPTVNRLLNAHTGYCLSIDGGAVSNGAHAVQDGCGYSADQDWQIRPRGDGLSEFRNDRSGQCLAVAGGSKQSGAHILQWPCASANKDQSWQIIANADEPVSLRNANSGQCLGIEGASEFPGAHLVQWPCQATNTSQDWFIDPRAVGQNVRNRHTGLCISFDTAVDGTDLLGRHAIQVACGNNNYAEWHTRARTGGYTELRIDDNVELCLAIEGGSRSAGAYAVMWTCRDANRDQNWLVSVDANGLTKLRNAHSGLCLAVAGGVKTSGARLVQWTCNANPDQNWELR